MLGPAAGAHAHHHHSGRVGFGPHLVHWVLMAAAMMLPFLREPIRFVAARSYRYRRVRSVAFFVLGFLLAWVLAGVPVALVSTLGGARIVAWSFVAFGLAAVWAGAPRRALALGACHAVPPLAPRGVAAEVSSMSAGVQVGARCVFTCFPLMVACAFTGHHPIVMAGCYLVAVSEKTAFQPRRSVARAGTLVVGFAWVLWCLAGPAAA